MIKQSVFFLLYLFALHAKAQDKWYSFDGKEYYFSNTVATYDGAVIACNLLGATIPKVETLAVQMFLSSTINDIGKIYL